MEGFDIDNSMNWPELYDLLNQENLVEDLQTYGRDLVILNFADLANITLASEGRAQISIYRSRAIELPFRILMMERHPFGSQAFFPLHDRPFPIVVVLPDSIPGPDTVRVFLSNGQQGINIHPGVWHHYQLTLDKTSDYLVIDRGGPGDNCDEYQLEQEVILDI